MTFFKRHTVTWVVTAIVSTIAFLAISSSAQYGDVSSRILNGIGAGFTFGAITFAIGWLATALVGFVRRRIRGVPSRAERVVDFSAPPVDPYRTGVGPPRRRPIYPTPAKSRAAGVFISYRREDEPSFAGRLYDRLVQEFGRVHVFMDVDSIEPGLDFVEVINGALAHCDALLAVVGSEWLTTADRQGRPRLENPGDYVRLEIESALRRNVRVIPILVDSTRMPAATDLPPSLRPFSRRNGFQVSYSRFRSDVEALVGLLRQVMSRVPPGAHGL